jgi:hypothetical protein
MTVIVLDGNENQAVAATRSLARAGHEVQVGAETGWSKAGWSRACRSTFTYPSPQDDVPGFVDRIVDVVRSHHAPIVLPMTERSMLPLSEARDRLRASGGALVLPEHDRVVQACDKTMTSRLARALGIAVPETRVVGDPADDDGTVIVAAKQTLNPGPIVTVKWHVAALKTVPPATIGDYVYNLTLPIGAPSRGLYGPLPITLSATAPDQSTVAKIYTVQGSAQVVTTTGTTVYATQNPVPSPKDITVVANQTQDFTLATP